MVEKFNKKKEKLYKFLLFFIFALTLIAGVLGAYWYGFLKGKESLTYLWQMMKKSVFIKTISQEEKFLDKKKWLVFRNDDFGIVFKYPKEMDVMGSVGGWKYFINEGSLGLPIVKLKIPAFYDPGTNFVEAFFSVGVSSSTLDIQKCLLPSLAETYLDTVDVGNKTFYKFKGEDQNYGHIYEVESYRTLHHNICYSLDTIIHYFTLENTNYESFHREKLQSLFDEILSTFYLEK